MHSLLSKTELLMHYNKIVARDVQFTVFLQTNIETDNCCARACYAVSENSEVVLEPLRQAADDLRALEVS